MYVSSSCKASWLFPICDCLCCFPFVLNRSNKRTQPNTQRGAYMTDKCALSLFIAFCSSNSFQRNLPDRNTISNTFVLNYFDIWNMNTYTNICFIFVLSHSNKQTNKCCAPFFNSNDGQIYDIFRVETNMQCGSLSNSSYFHSEFHKKKKTTELVFSKRKISFVCWTQRRKIVVDFNGSSFYVEPT